MSRHLRGAWGCDWRSRVSGLEGRTVQSGGIFWGLVAVTGAPYRPASPGVLRL